MDRSIRDRRRAFTLLECLIVIAMIGLLASIVYPVVLNSAESARRIQCQNNLRELGTAFLGYSSSNSGVFPSGMTIKAKAPILPTLNLAANNYMIDLLPYIDGATAVNNSFDREIMFSSIANSTAVSSSLKVCVCPSAIGREQPSECPFSPSEIIPGSVRENAVISRLVKELDDKYATSYGGGLIDYSAVAWIDKSVPGDYGLKSKTSWGMGVEGMFPYPIPDNYAELLVELRDAVVFSRPFVLSRPRPMRDLIDGATSTIMMIETAGRPQRWERGHRTLREEPIAGGVWADFRNLLRVKGAGGDNKHLLGFDNRDSPYSFHSGTINTLFADGHVEGLSIDTDGALFISLVSIDEKGNDSLGGH